MVPHERSRNSRLSPLITLLRQTIVRCCAPVRIELVEVKRAQTEAFKTFFFSF